MVHVLEAPRAPEELYRARGADEVTDFRPIFTGDVFARVPYGEAGGSPKLRDVMILQHPCALRTNGVDLASRLLVAAVRDFKRLDDWTTHGCLMPLPELRPDLSSARRRNPAAWFDDLYFVTPTQLEGRRISCLSLSGMTLLMQRWVYHSSRAVIPSITYSEANIAVYEEADVIEDWCWDRVEDGLSVAEATTECVDWLRLEKDDLPTRQAQLRDGEGQRSLIRRQALSHRRELRRMARGGTCV